MRNYIFFSRLVILLCVSTIFLLSACSQGNKLKKDEENIKDTPSELTGQPDGLDSFSNFNIADPSIIDSFALFSAKQEKKLKRVTLASIPAGTEVGGFAVASSCSITGPGSYCYKRPVKVSTLSHPSVAGADVDVRNIAVGRLNGGANLDFAFSGLNIDRMRFKLGSGDGSFWGTYTWTTGDGPSDIKFGDFNNDGRTDVIVTNVFDSRVRIRWGHTNWSSYSSYATGAGPWKIAVGDLNSDGFDDFVTNNIYDDNITVRLKNPGGGFGSSLYSSGFASRDISLVDVDKDGDLDLVYDNVLDGSARIVVRLNNGSGVFGAPINSASGLESWTQIQSMTFGDFNEDGNIDVIAALNTHSLLRAFGNGDGTFNHFISAHTAANPWKVYSTDFNGDGNLDIIVSYSTGGLRIYLGDGDGNMVEEIVYDFLGGFDVGIGDFNGDGNTDIVSYGSGEGLDSKSAYILLSCRCSGLTK